MLKVGDKVKILFGVLVGESGRVAGKDGNRLDILFPGGYLLAYFDYEVEKV